MRMFMCGYGCVCLHFKEISIKKKSVTLVKESKNKTIKRGNMFSFFLRLYSQICINLLYSVLIATSLAPAARFLAIFIDVIAVSPKQPIKYYSCLFKINLFGNKNVTADVKEKKLNTLH